MPQFKVTGPDGKSYRVNAPQGASQDDAIAYIANTYYGAPPPAPEPELPQASEQPKEEASFFGALKRGFTTLGDLPEAAGFAMGKKGAREELVKAQQEEAPANTGFGLDKTLGENIDALKELAGESIGFMAAPAAAGLAGSVVGGPIVGGGAALATLLSQYGTQNLARQAQEDEARVARGEAPLGAMPGRAAAAAVGQAGLDVAGFMIPVLRPMAAAFPFMRPLLGQAGKKAAGEVAEAVVEAAAKKQLTIKGGIARGVAQGAAFEIPQEVAQTTLERWQAGLPLDDEDALAEYKQAAIGAAVLGGGFGGIGGGINAAREQAQQKKEEGRVPPDLSTPEQQAKFADLLTSAVTSYVEANPDVSVQDALKALRDNGTLVSLGEQARADVEEAQAAGVAGPASGPDVDVAGAAGEGVQDTGVPLPAQEAPEGVPTAEPDGVAGAGVDTGGSAAPEAGAVGALTEEVAPAEPVAAAPEVAPAEPVAAAPEVAPAEPVAAAPEVAPAVDLLAPIKAAPNQKERVKVARPLVSNTVDELVGDVVVPSQVLTNITTEVSREVATGANFDLKTRVGELLTKNGIEIAPAPTMEVPSVAETTAPAAPEVAPSPTEAAAPEAVAAQEITPSPVVQTPAYTYADLTAEADSLVAPNPDMVLPGQLTAQQFQQFTMQADAVAEAAKQGMPVPSPVELRQRLYEVVGREPPPLETPAAPEAEAAPEALAPEVVEAAPEPAPAPVGFKTAMGSTYTLDAEGRTTREKAKRGTPGHEGDFGPKATSAKTVYVDSAEQAAALSAAGLQGLTSKGARVAIKDGKATLLTWNPKAGKWGATPSSRDIPVYSEPAVGRAPLELWKPAKDVPGYEAYSKMHAGNQITELMTPAAPVAATPTSAAAEPVAPAAAAPPAAPPGVPPTPPVPPSGAAPQPGGKGPKKPRAIKITKAKMQWAMREAGLLRRRDDAFRKKIARSQTAHQLSDSIGDMFFGTRAYQGPMNMLRLLRDSLTPQAKRIILPFLPTDDITRWVGDRLPVVERINKLIDDLTVYRNKRHEKTSVIANKWTKFMTASPKGADTLDVLIKLADFHDVDPTQAATAEEYAKNDPEMKRLIKEKASQQKRNNRLSAIREVYAEWAQLGRKEAGGGAGREIFKLAKEAYRRNLVDSYVLTLNRISEAGMSPENEKAAVSQIKYMYKEALSRRVYFPVMRYGRYWFSVGKGPNIEYYMFENALQRDMAFIKRQEDMAKENDLRDMLKGNDYKEVTEYLTRGRDASVALKNVFELLDSGNADDTVALKDTIFQMYLLALPEGDMRKRFSHRRYVAGFGMDSMRDFVAGQNRAASQLARLSYAHQVRMELGTLEESAKERGDFVDLEPFVREISERAKAEVDPPLRGGFYAWMDKFATLGNKLVFLWMLTAPKSALIQATQLHTVGLPVLSDEFGFAKVMKIAGQYSGDILLGNKLAIHRKDANGDIVTEFDLNMRNAKFMQDMAQSDPKKYKRLLKAYDYFDQRGTFASTYISDLNDTASRPSREGSALAALKRGRFLSAATQGGQAAMQFMSAGFHQMENLNRQIMAMTSFELAYEQARANGLSEAAAEEQAMERALKVTRETMFNYSNYNKPRAFKNPVGRIATQFMTYPVMMTSYLARNFKNMISELPPEGKLSAAKRFFGTLGITAMYAGLTGLPLYSVIMAAAEAAREMMRDDDDFAPYEDDKGNPLGKVSLKYWFENSWLPETFGPDSSLAKALNMPPELAILLERSAKFGPISALSDVNIASSTSLDSLFFRGDVKADTLEGQFKDMLYNQLLGPLGGLVSNMTRGAQLYDEGETTRAMELMLPAFVKGAVRASRLEDEGLRTIDGKVVKDAEFYTMGKLFSQMMGFGSTEAYEAQKQNIEGKQIIDEIKAERNALIQEVKNAELRYLDKPSESTKRAADRAYNKLEEFGNRFPFSSIGGDTVGEAMSNALKERAGSVGGAEVDPEYPVMEDVIARRIQRGE